MLEGLPGWVAVELEARHPAHGVTHGAGVTSAHLGSEVEIDIRYVHEPVARVWGRIELNGRPLPSSGVSWTWSFRKARQGGRLDLAKDGSYELNVRPGHLTLVPVLRTSRDENIEEFFTDLRHGHNLLDGDQREQNWLLELPFRPIAGVVRVEDGGPPIPGVEVHVGTGARFLATARTDREGRFEVEVPTTRTYTVQARHGRSERKIEAVPAGTDGLELLFPPTYSFTVEVFDAFDHRPVKDYLLFAREVGDDSRYFLLDDPRLLPGTYDFQVHAEGSSYVPRTIEGFTVDPLEPHTSLRVPVVHGADVTFTIETPWSEWEDVFLLEVEHLERLAIGRGHWEASLSEVFPPSTLERRRLRPGRGGVVRLRGLAPGTYGFFSERQRLVIKPVRIVIAPEQTSLDVFVEGYEQ